MRTAQEWIAALNLAPHPEGGFFHETYRAPNGLALPGRYGGPRPHSTAIYFLLEAHQTSKLHRIQSDELWHFYTGAPLCIHVITPAGERADLLLGPDFSANQRFQALVPAGCWFGARPLTSPSSPSFSLVGCTVAPGFAFADFELAQRHSLTQRYPQHAALIHSLT